MPELPEVETVRKTLEYQLANDEIIGVEVKYSTMLTPSKEDFIYKLPGQKINSLKRQVKRY